MTMWRTLIGWLAAMSADPQAIDIERPKAYAAYRVAYATFAPADGPQPQPEPAPPTPPAPRPTREPARACQCGGSCSPACTCGCHGAAAGGKCANGTCPLPVESRGSR